MVTNLCFLLVLISRDCQTNKWRPSTTKVKMIPIFTLLFGVIVGKFCPVAKFYCPNGEIVRVSTQVVNMSKTILTESFRWIPNGVGKHSNAFFRLILTHFCLRTGLIFIKEMLFFWQFLLLLTKRQPFIFFYFWN